MMIKLKNDTVFKYVLMVVRFKFKRIMLNMNVVIETIVHIWTTFLALIRECKINRVS